MKSHRNDPSNETKPVSCLQSINGFTYPALKNNNTFTWSIPSRVLAAPDNGPQARDTVVQNKTLDDG
jgi:hypothetical protein